MGQVNDEKSGAMKKVGMVIQSEEAMFKTTVTKLAAGSGLRVRRRRAR